MSAGAAEPDHAGAGAPGGLLADLTERGLVAQSTDPEALAAALEAGPVTLYAGFDPTASSLHVGHLLPLLTLRRFQAAGHRPIALVGGATGLVGDPSGRASERTLNAAETVEAWSGLFQGELGRFLDRDGPAAGAVVNNLDWTRELSVLAFLRDIGKHFSVSVMLAKESVSTRMGTAGGLSFTEFSYMLLQAMDFLELHRRYGCVLQIGGSDQWGNITAGLDLLRRVEGATGYGLTVPLLVDATGAKFGKTAAGATVWLDPGRTSPFAFYQFWLNQPDTEVPLLLRRLTFLDLDEIRRLEESLRQRPAAREAQRALARELTGLVHGRAACDGAERAAAALFGQGELADLDDGLLAAVAAEVGSTLLSDAGPPGDPAGAGGPLVANLLVDSGLVIGRKEARRVIRDGGAYLNNARVDDEAACVGDDAFLHGRWLVLRRGRRAVAIVERT